MSDLSTPQTVVYMGTCKEHRLCNKEETMKVVLVSSLTVYRHQWVVFLFPD